MSTNIARSRLTIGHIIVQIEKEEKRYKRLKTPRLKSDSGVRLAMLKDRLTVNYENLNQQLAEAGYRSEAWL